MGGNPSSFILMTFCNHIFLMLIIFVCPCDRFSCADLIAWSFKERQWTTTIHTTIAAQPTLGEYLNLLLFIFLTLRTMYSLSLGVWFMLFACLCEFGLPCRLACKLLHGFMKCEHKCYMLFCFIHLFHVRLLFEHLCHEIHFTHLLVDLRLS